MDLVWFKHFPLILLIVVWSAPGFTLAVQWHPEYNAAADPVSRPLFAAFGEAVRNWATVNA